MTDEPRAGGQDERYVAELVGSLSDEDFLLDELPPDLWDRIDAAAGPTAAATPEPGPGADRSVSAPRPAPVPGRRRWVPLLVAAVVIAVAVIAGAFVRTASSPEGEVAARARLTSEGLARTSDLVGEAELVDVAGRQEIDLDLPGLPADPDAFFEVWLLAPDGTRLQSLGATDGRGRYLVPAGIDPRQYPVVDVSREPPDGNPAHSGDSLVRGVLA
jgi:hypothetical protein